MAIPAHAIPRNQLPPLITAAKAAARVLIVQNTTTAEIEQLLPEALVLTVEDVYEDPEILEQDKIIILKDAKDCMTEGTIGFLFFMSLVQRVGYTARMIAPVPLGEYDAHALQYGLNMVIA